MGRFVADVCEDEGDGRNARVIEKCPTLVRLGWMRCVRERQLMRE